MQTCSDQRQLVTGGDAPAVTKKPAVIKPRRDIRLAAMNLLARREQSFHELLSKLGNKFSNSPQHPAELIEEQLSRLRDEGLQSDSRFASSLVNSKKNSGKGPNAVRYQLQQKGLSGELIATTLEVVADEWPSLAEALYRRKYADKPMTSVKEQAKRMRFMQGRGFNSEHYLHLLRFESV